MARILGDLCPFCIIKIIFLFFSISSSSTAKKSRLEHQPIQTANLDADDPIDDSDDANSDDSDDDSDDDTAALMAELQKIKREKAAEEKEKEEVKRQEEERIRYFLFPKNVLANLVFLSFKKLKVSIGRRQVWFNSKIVT